MSVLGLGAGGGIKDEDDGLAGGNIDGVGGTGTVFGDDFFSISSCSRGDVSMPFDLSLLRENEGTAPFGCVAVDLGVASSCSVSSGSRT